MGSGGTLWEGPICNPPDGDLISHDRLNQKTIYVGPSAPSSICETALFAGQISGYKEMEYQVQACHHQLRLAFSRAVDWRRGTVRECSSGHGCLCPNSSRKKFHNPSPSLPRHREECRWQARLNLNCTSLKMVPFVRKK